MASDVEPINPGQASAAGRLCNFTTGQSRLLSSHIAWLDATVIPLLRNTANPWVDVFGYASRSGDAQFNKRLSDQRCQAVVDHIKAAVSGVSFPQQFGYGESQSGGRDNDNDGYWRAVELYVYATGRPPAPAPTPPPAPNFVCGPDVTTQVRETWSRIQVEFRARSRRDKISLCNEILLPVKDPAGLVKEVTDSLLGGKVPDLNALLAKVRAHAKIDGWDVIPLYQGASEWLRTPPIFDPALNGPMATPSSSDYANPDPFAAGHEDEATCSNTVQVAGQCWLNGSVNYGTYGIMVRLCSEFAASDIFIPNTLSKNPFDHPLKFNPVVRAIYSLLWATMLIKAYKKFGNNPEGAIIPVAWTKATFEGGPAATPGLTGNRPKCQFSAGPDGSIVTWDYVWEPLKPRDAAKLPK
ncbi:hypothetical protein C5L14_03225 [Labrys okinawensis]|uniref:OmpA-like domain-containing protein n=1 Tax=Labrys okinawensis TaxID=346911 RepID=A0A2S9QJQ9_9HYPH|nr:hypothetical protein C5L14_03225 [Labrys okinawensis]